MKSQYRPYFLKPVLVIVLAVMLFLTVLQGITPAQSTSQLSSRISRLESENSLLRSRLGRIESRLSQVGQLPDLDIPESTPQISGESPLATDPMFTRLATLVIELRERIIALETRLGINSEQ
jgi:hypothetical protein